MLPPRDLVFALGKARDFPALAMKRRTVPAGERAWREWLAGCSIFEVGEALRVLDADAQEPARGDTPARSVLPGGMCKMKPWTFALLVAGVVCVGCLLFAPREPRAKVKAPANVATAPQVKAGPSAGGKGVKMPAIQIYDEDGHAAAPVRRTMPLPAQMQVGTVPVDATHRLPMRAQPAEWTAVTTATQAGGTLTKAGETGESHFITGVDVSVWGSGGSCMPTPVELKDGDTVIWRTYTPPVGVDEADRLHVSFPHPLKLTAGAAANLVLTPFASGPATVHLGLAGYTRAE